MIHKVLKGLRGNDKMMCTIAALVIAFAMPVVSYEIWGLEALVYGLLHLFMMGCLALFGVFEDGEE